MQRPFFSIYILLIGLLSQATLGSRHVFKRTPTHGEKMFTQVDAAEENLWKQHSGLVENVKGAMLASIRTRYVRVVTPKPRSHLTIPYSWEQGTAAHAILEIDNPEYSVFAEAPFQAHGPPIPTLQLALSAAVRQTADGRLSQQINDAEDGAALDGASAGSAVMLGSFAPNPRGAEYWLKAAERQMAYLKTVKRTSTGALSHRADTRQYWCASHLHRY